MLNYLFKCIISLYERMIFVNNIQLLLEKVSQFITDAGFFIYVLNKYESLLTHFFDYLFSFRIKKIKLNF